MLKLFEIDSLCTVVNACYCVTCQVMAVVLVRARTAHNDNVFKSTATRLHTVLCEWITLIRRDADMHSAY